MGKERFSDDFFWLLNQQKLMGTVCTTCTDGVTAKQFDLEARKMYDRTTAGVVHFQQ